MNRQSSVPDREFDRPKSIEELQGLISLSAEIMYHVATYLAEDGDAWNIANRAHGAIVNAYSVIVDVKWIGIPEWRKKAA